MRHVLVLYCSIFTGKVKIESSDGGKPKEFEVKITLVAKIDLDEVNKFLNQVKQGNHNAVEASMIVKQAIDVVLRHSLASRFICVGSSFFSPPKDCIYALGTFFYN
jgi:hypothetical protein